MLVAFDMNETVLDLRALDPVFARAFGDAALRGQWFAQMVQLAFVGGLTDRYVDYSSAQRAALRMLAARTGTDLRKEDAEEIVDTMRRLPAHPDAASALEQLRDAGLRRVALTNSTLEVARDQVANAGLSELFDDVLSADEVRALKPAPAPYRMVAERSRVPIGDVWLVACHPWDVSGALAAGCHAALVARPGFVASPLGPQPDLVGADLGEVAAGLLARLHA
jgi:2-haloacid dehalogenase